MSKKVTMTVESKGDYETLLRALDNITRQEVLVGIPEEADPPRKDGEQINNAALAFIHDNGSPGQNIPARPFFDPGIQDVKPQLIERLKAVAKASLAGNASSVTKGLIAVGMVAVSGVRNRLNTGPFVPLAPATIRARKARGRTGIKPLVDTGQLRNAITYVLRKVTGA